VHPHGSSTQARSSKARAVAGASPDVRPLHVDLPKVYMLRALADLPQVSLLSVDQPTAGWVRRHDSKAGPETTPRNVVPKGVGSDVLTRGHS